MKNNQSKFFAGAAVVVVAITYLVYTGIEETSVYYLTVTEAVPMKSSTEDMRIEGLVLAGSIQKDKDSLGASFMLTDDSENIPVTYRGALPDLFDDDIDVVVQGKFDQSSGKFEAHTLLTSCPSKYEATEEEGMKASFIPRPLVE